MPGLHKLILSPTLRLFTRALYLFGAPRIVSAEEEAEAVKGLPAMEKTLYWLISLMYGPSSRSRIAPAEDEDDMTNCVARGNASEPLPGQRGLNFVSENSENSSSSSSSSSSSDSELTATTSESSHALEQVLNVNQPWPDSPYAVKSRKAPAFLLRMLGLDLFLEHHCSPCFTSDRHPARRERS